MSGSKIRRWCQRLSQGTVLLHCSKSSLYTLRTTDIPLRKRTHPIPYLPLLGQPG